MSKLHTYIHRIMLVGTLALLSCEKLEIPSDTPESIAVADSTTDKDEEPASSSYSVSDIIHGRYTETADVHVTGYIVGYVKSNSMDFCRFSRGDVETNIIIADTPIETSPDKCIPVQLSTANTACKATRSALNLAQNNVLKQKIRLQGDIGKYMGTDGILKAHNHTFLEDDFDYSASTPDDDSQSNDTPDNPDNDTPDNPNPDTPDNPNNGDGQDDDNPDTPDSPIIPNNPDNPDGEEDGQDTNPTDPNQQWEDLVAYITSHGTPDAPFTIADFKTNLPDYLSHFGAPEIGHPGMKERCICGYIVGYIPKNYYDIKKTVFGYKGAPQSNIVLADSPDEQDWNNCIAVQLSTSSGEQKDTRDALNLADHPENYKKCFIILGDITDYRGYMGTLGLKSAKGWMPTAQ